MSDYIEFRKEVLEKTSATLGEAWQANQTKVITNGIAGAVVGWAIQEGLWLAIDPTGRGSALHITTSVGCPILGAGVSTTGMLYSEKSKLRKLRASLTTETVIPALKKLGISDAQAKVLLEKAKSEDPLSMIMALMPTALSVGTQTLPRKEMMKAAMAFIRTELGKLSEEDANRLQELIQSIVDMLLHKEEPNPNQKKKK
jgi:hypothetical protein